MMMTNTVVAWEPLKHVRWLDESGWMGPGTSMALDYYLSTENGKTRVRLVQSAFGASEGWDDLFDGIKTGWTYFLQNLRIYLEKHLGRVRRMITERIEVDMPRQKFWRHLLSDAAGFVIGGAGGEGGRLGRAEALGAGRRVLGLGAPAMSSMGRRGHGSRRDALSSCTRSRARSRLVWNLRPPRAPGDPCAEPRRLPLRADRARSAPRRCTLHWTAQGAAPAPGPTGA